MIYFEEFVLFQNPNREQQPLQRKSGMSCQVGMSLSKCITFLFILIDRKSVV